MARVHTIDKSRKSPGECGHCRKVIPAGEGYRYAQPGYRNRRKLIRCMAPACHFRQSELTNSKMSTVYAATENAEDTINGWDGEDADDIAEALRECAGEINDVASEYGDAAQAMGSAGDEMQEKADELESWAGDIESAADSLPDKPEPETDEDEGHDFEAKPDTPAGTEVLCKHCDKPEADALHYAEGAEKPEDTEQLDAWRQEVRDAALEAIGNCPV